MRSSIWSLLHFLLPWSKHNFWGLFILSLPFLTSLALRFASNATSVSSGACYIFILSVYCLFEFGVSPLYSVLTHLLDSLFQSVSAEGSTDLLRDLDLSLTQRCSLLCCARKWGYYPFKNVRSNLIGKTVISFWLFFLSLLMRLNFAPTCPVYNSFFMSKHKPLATFYCFFPALEALY